MNKRGPEYIREYLAKARQWLNQAEAAFSDDKFAAGATNESILHFGRASAAIYCAVHALDRQRKKCDLRRGQ